MKKILILPLCLALGTLCAPTEAQGRVDVNRPAACSEAGPGGGLASLCVSAEAPAQNPVAPRVAPQAGRGRQGPAAGGWACGHCGNNNYRSGPRALSGRGPGARGRGAARNGRGRGQGPAAGRGAGAATGPVGGPRGGRCSGDLAQLAPADTGALDATPRQIAAYIARLQETLEKELYARDYYLAADQALSGPAKFGNLAGAEQNHADAVAAMIVFLGGAPDYVQNVPVVPPQSLAEAEAHCVQIELTVIAVYDGLIQDCVARALLGPLNNIQASNYKHLSVMGG